MNRKEEMEQLSKELNEIPSELDFIVTRVNEKIRRQRRKSYKIGGVVVLSCMIAFVVMVNAFPSVAYAISNIPVLDYFVKAVSFDKSLKRAMEEDYYQLVSETKSKDGVEVTVEYMIVDASRISIFYKDTVPNGINRDGASVYYEDGTDLNACSEMSMRMENTDELSEFRIDLADDEAVPEKVIYTMEYSKKEGEKIEVSFTLEPEAQYAKVVKSVVLDKKIVVEEQTITLNQIDIYPTQTKLKLSIDESNQAIIKELEIELIDQNGNRYGTKENGITSSSDETGNVVTIWFESCYFEKESDLTLCISGIRMIDREKLYGEIDVNSQTISNLPEGVTIKSMKLEENELTITLCGKLEENNRVQQLGRVRCDDLADESASGETEFHHNMENKEYEQILHLVRYEGEKYRIEWYYSPMKELEEQIVMEIRIE